MTRPFHTPETTRLIELLNKPSFTERTYTVALSDSKVGGSGYLGSVANTTLGAFNVDYVIGSRGNANLTTGLFSVGVARFVPFVMRHGFRITQLGLTVTTLGASAVFRLAIYDCVDDLNGDLTPSRLIYGSPEQSAGTAGAKTITGLTIDLPPDRVYWVAYLGGTAAPVINSVPMTNIGHTLGGIIGAPPVLNSCLHSTFAYAAFPATWTAAFTESTQEPPAIFVQFTRNSSTATTRVLPCMTVVNDGWWLQRARIVKADTLTKGATTYPYAVVKARVRNGATVDVIGTFDSRTKMLSAGVPMGLTGTQDLEQRLTIGTVLEAEVTQSGWPRVSLDDAVLEFDLVYAGA
jgi:hypothetical protein